MARLPGAAEPGHYRSPGPDKQRFFGRGRDLAIFLPLLFGFGSRAALLKEVAGHAPSVIEVLVEDVALPEDARIAPVLELLLERRRQFGLDGGVVAVGGHVA